MRRIQGWTMDKIIAYNLRYDGTQVTIFADAQTDRVNRARAYVSTILERIDGRATIVEPGCSAGDIGGFFSEDHDVSGCDVVPAAVAATRARYPKMSVEQLTAEEWGARECDILILCEFLEHIHDPVTFVKEWLPLAKYVVIGHPLVQDGWDPEEGHIWAYYPDDFEAWFPMGGHTLREWQLFPMGYQMIMGWGERT